MPILLIAAVPCTVKWLWDRSANDGIVVPTSDRSDINRVSSDDDNPEEHRTRLLTEESNSTEDNSQCISVECKSIEISKSGDDRPRLFNLFGRKRRTRDTNNKKKNNTNKCLLPSQFVEDESCNKSGCDDIIPMYSMNNVNINDNDDNTSCIRIDDEFESLLPIMHA
jgi:hypothetical protein